MPTPYEEPAGERLVPRRHCLLSLESFGCPPSTPSGLLDTSVGSGALHPPRLLPQALGQGTNLSARPQGQDSVGETRTCSPGPRNSGLITCRQGFRGPGILLHLLGGPWRTPRGGLAQGAAPGACRPGPHRRTARRGEHEARWCRTLEVLQVPAR